MKFGVSNSNNSATLPSPGLSETDADCMERILLSEGLACRQPKDMKPLFIECVVDGVALLFVQKGVQREEDLVPYRQIY